MSGSFFGGLVFACKFTGMLCFTMFSESRLWECRVLQCFLKAVCGNVMFFTVFAYRQVRFDCIFPGFADNRLWEYRIFLLKKACLAQTSRVFLWIFLLFLFLEALQGFVRLWEVLEGFGKFLEALRVLLALQSFARLWEALSGGLERLRKVLGGFVT